MDLENGYLIDGFPSAGLTSAIATESIIHTSAFKIGGIIDSDSFPPVSIIKDGKPNYPTRIFINEQIKVGIFSSYLSLHQSLHRIVAKTMLSWARKKKCQMIVSSAMVKAKKDKQSSQFWAVASTEEARKKIEQTGIPILQQGTIPGIPGSLLNEGMMNNQNVVVLLFSPEEGENRLKSSADLCLNLSKLVPGTSCDISSLQKEAQHAEEEIAETERETRTLRDAMYR